MKKMSDSYENVSCNWGGVRFIGSHLCDRLIDEGLKKNIEHFRQPSS